MVKLNYQPSFTISAAGPRSNNRTIRCALISITFGVLSLLPAISANAQPTDGSTAYNPDEFLENYCYKCHNDLRMSGNWSLDDIHYSDIQSGHSLGEWEAILRTTARKEMPPANRPQPSIEEFNAFVSWLQQSLDGHAQANPDPGRATLRRLNRNEYNNAVRDLLHLNVDIRDQLPADNTGYGFDNIADVLSVSPTLMNKYINLAGKISQLATGTAPNQPYVKTFTLPKDGSILNQGIPSYDWRMSNQLPLDSRGGNAFDFFAPQAGVYEISGYLNSNTNNEVDRLTENRVAFKTHLTAGEHTIGISFRKSLALDESVQTLRNTTDRVPLPTEAPSSHKLDFIVDGARIGSTQVPSYHMSPRYAQHNFLRDIVQIDIDGPYDTNKSTEVDSQSFSSLLEHYHPDTKSQAKIFICRPGFLPGSDTRCAKKIISQLAQEAYRRPVNDQDIQPLMKLYEQSAEEEGFDKGIATAIQALLVSPSFLFLHEQDYDSESNAPIHPISDHEFAARLSLFLWSSIPDAELFKLANKGKLRESNVLQQQIARMLADPKAVALQDNFSGQWLYLRNLDHHRADVYLYPEFDAPLREAMRKESELFFGDIMRNDASILNFIKSDYTFLNERLAAHYGIEGVNGPAMRKVALPEDSGRGGLLGQSSILTVTSYGNHTSVVKRGKWILDNILAAPPPPPPEDVPALVMKKAGKALNAREQLALHSEDPACATCHVKMDPLGLALENYNAIGGLRLTDADRFIDVRAKMPDGTEFEGLYGLQDLLMDRKDQFTGAFTQRLMTYALGRGLEAQDQPQVRQIVQQAKANNYRIQSIILGIVTSQPFNYRRTLDHVSNQSQQKIVSTRNGDCASTAISGITDSKCTSSQHL